jgi:serine/threonine protein kinase
MKRVCTNCGQIAPHGNAWCQNRDCPSGTLTTIFDYGDSLGDIEVVQLMRVFRSSAIYEAQRGSQPVLLKVAHDGAQEQLKRESVLLKQLAEVGANPHLPTLLSPYQFTDKTPRPYGKTAFRDETKYYEVFEYVKGEFLRDILIRNPQPWYQHASWITVSIADAIAFMNVKGGKLHLNITPDMVYVRTDREGIPRPILLDLGAVADPNEVSSDWVNTFAVPSYTPPELLDHGQVGVASDVYGLGLLFYEMLAGHPAFPFDLRKDEEVRRNVRTVQPEQLNRTDLSQDINEIGMQTLDKVPSRRPADIRTFAKQLRTKFGEVPPEKTGIQLVTRRQLAIGAASTLLIAVLLVLGLVINSSGLFSGLTH